MKNYFILFLLFIIGGILYLYFDNREIGPPEYHSEFVSLRDGKFVLRDQPYFPITLNYVAALNFNNHIAWLSPSHHYNFNNRFDYFNPDSAWIYLRADFENIKSSGFNSLRIVGVSETSVDIQNGNQLLIRAFSAFHKDTLLNVNAPDFTHAYRAALSKLMDIADEYDLKIILLNKVIPGCRVSENHFANVASSLSERSTLLAFDLFNEPLYFDSLDRSKKEVFRLTRSWKKLARENCPKHLITVGLEGMREILKWDPNLVDVDFLSFHPYEYEPDQVRNAIYWYGKYVDKPWMIGETAIPADNDSIPYSEQAEFARKTFEQAYNCGAIGYSWWQYKDVRWNEFHPSFMGVFTQEGETFLPGVKLAVEGTPKPIVAEIKKFDASKPKGNCVFLPNYYNYTDNTAFAAQGKVTDDNEIPIEGAVILGWSKDWSKAYHTVSKSDGSFEILSDFPLYHFRVSATKYSMLSIDFDPELSIHDDRNIPVLDTGSWKLLKLSLR